MATGWSKPPTAFIKVVEQDLGQKRHQVAVEALAAVVASSPVDSGAYRANHRVSIDGVDLGYDLEKIDPSGAETLQAGNEAISSAASPYCETVIQNNIPYGEVLEDGHSGQAPAGVYGVAFAAVVEKHTK
ncbi:hypothetical protein [Alcaligenes sp. CHO6]|uniref:hypothetical protein n=1 Tax=Alcaligenes sp. CHO6 TaxID=3123298 RepID=UPI003014FDBD